MYEMLLTNDECAKAEDLGNFYRVPVDNRTLNYDKFFTKENTQRVQLSEFNSNTTKLLTIEEARLTIANLIYIQNELNGVPNLI